jgi:hypothetical protein
MTLDDELEVIDQTLSELEGRRAEIIYAMESAPKHTNSKLIQFPNPTAIGVQTYDKAAAVNRPGSSCTR